MSRIDDDGAARQAERVAEQRRIEDKLRVDKQATNTVFSRLVSDSQKQQGQNINRGHASEAHAKFLEKADPSSAARMQADKERVLGRYARAGGESNAVLRELMGQEGESAKASSENNKPLSQKQLKEQSTQHSQEQATKLQQGDRNLSKTETREQAEVGKKSASETESQVEGRSAQAKSDAKKYTAAREESKSIRAEEKTSDMRQAAELKRSNKEPQEDLGRLLNTNPALMEPAPLVRPKPTGDSERLRRIASEIAQKIVERVRVGTNKAGNAEFQIDFRSDVLSGLSMRVSSSGGKISVVFSGSDKNALKVVEEQSDALHTALDVRGLTLTHLKFEMNS
ncbi:MAG: hypothetical protein FWG75_07270 [Cystobacterineae bacterium]|nr:hypothetical protein [Cystobacterineae bacterium]